MRKTLNLLSWRRAPRRPSSTLDPLAPEDARALIQAHHDAHQSARAEAAMLRSELAALKDDNARLRRTAETRDGEKAALRGRLARLQAELAGGAAKAAIPADIGERAVFGDAARALNEAAEPIRRRYADLLFDFAAALERRGQPGLARLAQAQPVLHALAHALDDRSSVLVFADIDPASCDPAGGYAQRVLAIDAMLAGRARIYARYSEANRGAPSLDRAGEEAWVLWLADDDPVSEALLDAVAAGSLLYVHTVLSAGVGASRRAVLAHADRAVLDMHGATPEEFALAGDAAESAVFGAHERLLYGAAARVVCVTQAMADHLAGKLGPPRAPAIICPIFQGRATPVPVARRNARPRVVYAGGAQTWQQPDKMLDLIAATRARCDYVLLTPDLEPFAAGLAVRGVAQEGDGVTLASVRPEAIAAHYAAADLGLVLREDSVVNRVACPTKLIEYLAHDVTPVLDCPHVGDFAAHGLQYVALEDLRAGRLPRPEGYRRMARVNRAVLERLTETAEAGRRAILAFADGAAPARDRAAA